MTNDDYDPGPLYEPPSYRRRRQSRGEQDDAWAAADEEDFYDDGADIEDYAAGYVDHERTRQQERADAPENWQDGEQWSSSVNRARARGQYPRRANYDRDAVYGRSPTHYRDRMKRGEYGEYHTAHRAPYESASGSKRGLHIPFWQVLLIVSLVLGALLAAALACITILLL
ncbi:MAG: hypothetical protein JXA10_15360 [Anaerolineae bacterium]|nr:hypothetical protein [Anaerolineae bacterium]